MVPRRSHFSPGLQVAVSALVLIACAEIPSGTCFADEACADAGSSRADGGTGGSLGGGTGGGGGDTGGGTGGGTQLGGGSGGGGEDAGVIQSVFSSMGIADTWVELQAELPPADALPPSFTNIIEASLDGGIAFIPGCTEAFRGAVALPDGRAIAIPFCARQFAIVDPDAGTAGWFGPMAINPVAAGSDPGHFGGGVFGCDGRVYVLPYRNQSHVRRFTLEPDGGITGKDLPLTTLGPFLFSGGVIARPCAEGFRIIAASEGGLVALDPTETNVSVTRIPSGVATARFHGVARLGDDVAISSTATSTTNLLTLRVDSTTLVATIENSPLAEAQRGIATLRNGDAFVVTEAGVGYPILDGGAGPSGTVSDARQRWPTNTLTGWVFSAGNALLAWDEAAVPTRGSIVLDPAVGDTGAFTSGGLVLTTSGALVNVPGTTTRGVITLYRRATATDPPGVAALSPWFNKL